MAQEITQKVTDTSVTAIGRVETGPEQVYEFLRDPKNHQDLDGSGMIRAASQDDGSRGNAHHGPLTEVGQVFVMDMLWTDGSTKYQVENTVTALSPDRIEWLVADYGNEPQGWRWGWSLAEVDGATQATNYCDWSDITDPEVLEEKGFPVVDVEKIAQTVRALQERFA